MAVLALAACGPHTSAPVIVNQTPPPSTQPTDQTLQTLLDRRAQGMLEGDESEFLSGLDTANSTMVADEQMLFANLRQFPLTQFRYVLGQAAAPTQSGNSYTFAPVIEVVQLSTDAGPAGVAPGEAFVYDVTGVHGSWMISSITPIVSSQTDPTGEVPSDEYANAPWDLTPLSVAHVGNVWLAADGSVTDLTSYASAAQSQLGLVEGLWGDRPHFPGYVLFLTDSAADWKAWYGNPMSSGLYDGIQEELTGVTEDGSQDPSQYVASRIVVNLAADAAVGQNPDTTMRHELTHAVTTRVMSVSITTGDGGSFEAARWAVEGFANWVETINQPDVQEEQRAIVTEGVAADRFTGVPPPSPTFYGGDAQTVDFNYDLSASFFAYVAGLKGQQSAAQLYEKIVAQTGDLVTSQEPDGSTAFNSMCESVLGTSSTTLMQGWEAYVRGGEQ